MSIWSGGEQVDDKDSGWEDTGGAFILLLAAPVETYLTPGFSPFKLNHSGRGPNAWRCAIRTPDIHL
jgi:hypothetical protein